MFPGVVISLVLMIWMLLAGGNSKSNKPKGKADVAGKIVAGKGGYIIIQKVSSKES